MVTQQKRVLTHADFSRLSAVTNGMYPPLTHLRPYSRRLWEHLHEAELVAPEEVRHDVVTMKSRVRLRDVESGASFACILVYPHEAGLADECVSVLSPLGAALLGASVGDSITHAAGSGVRTLIIEELMYQPEATGHYGL